MEGQNLGGVYYEVGADIEPLLQGSNKAKQALDAMGDNANKSANGFKTLETQAKRSTIAINQATNGASKFRGVAGQMGYQLQDVAVQLQMGQNALMVFGQQGSQLAGAFGPGGAIVGAIIAVAAAVGSALIPNLIDASTSVEDIESALDTLNKTISFSKNGVAALSNDYALLAKTNRALAEAVRDNALAKLEQDASKAGDAIKGVIAEQSSWLGSFGGGVANVQVMGGALAALSITTDDYSEATKQAAHAGLAFQAQSNTINATVGMLADNFGISADQAYILARRMIDVANNPTPQAVNQLNTYLATLHSTTEGGSNALQDFKTNITNAGAEVSKITAALEMFKNSMNGVIATAQQQANFEAMLESLKQQEIGYRKGAQAAKEYAIEHADLNEQQKKELIEQSRVTEGARKESEARKKAEQEARKHSNTVNQSANTLSRMAQQYDIAQLKAQGLEREAAQLAAVQSLGEKATNAEAMAAANLAGKLFDLTKAEEARRQSKQGQKFAQQEIASSRAQVNPATGQAVDPLAQVNLEEQQKLEALAQYQETDKQNTQLYEDAKTAIQQQASNERQRIAQEEAETNRRNLSDLLGNTSDFFGQMAGAIGDYAGESSGAYKALFAVSKGFAIAQAALNLQTAIGNAMALPWPANIPAIAAAIAQGTQLISSVRGVNYGGGRKNGGGVKPGRVYEFGEGGLPEMLQMGGKNYLLPGNNGTVISNKELMGSNGQPQIPKASNGSQQLKNTANNDRGSSNSVSVVPNFTVLVENHGSPMEVLGQQYEKGMNEDDVIRVVVSNVQQGGEISQAFSRHHQAPRRAAE